MCQIVLSRLTKPPSPFANQSPAIGEISTNTFTGNNIDLHSIGSWFRLNVKNNNFSGSQYGILADGENTYSIENNTFYNSYAGSILFSNGDSENIHAQNQFNTIIGVHSLNENTGYGFLDNCFSTTGGDVYIDGSTLPQIGEESREAGNCFTKLGIPDISATGASFEYYRPDSKINTCSDPVTSGFYSKKHGESNQDLSCGSGVPFADIINDYCNYNIKTLTCSQAKILSNQILQQITFIKNSNTYSNPKQKEYLLKRLGLCRTRLIKFLIGCIDKVPDDPKLGDGSYIQPTDGIQARNELKNSDNKYESAAFVGLSIELGMWQEASAYLSSMPYTDEEMTDFRDVQFINIEYLQNRDSFYLTPTQAAMLVDHGNKSYPLAAYGRGLYYQLTGETIYPDIPLKTFSRSKTGNDISVSIYPNPVDNLMTITHSNDSYQVTIMNISGRVILSQVMEGGTSSFTTSIWPSGLYIVTLQELDGRVSSYKVVKH